MGGHGFETHMGEIICCNNRGLKRVMGGLTPNPLIEKKNGKNIASLIFIYQFGKRDEENFYFFV